MTAHAKPKGAAKSPGRVGRAPKNYLGRDIRAATAQMIREEFFLHLKLRGIPLPVWEFKFANHRQFRFDYAWPDRRVALEVDGGAFTLGRHTRGLGFARDIEKYNIAAQLGWRVVRALPDSIRDHTLPRLTSQAVLDTLCAILLGPV